jgi:hypothetical protein
VSSTPQQAIGPRTLPAWASWLFVLLPPLVAYGILIRFFTSVPIIDDYPELFAFAIDFEKAPSLFAKLSLLFTAQIGPYKLILDHAFVGLQLLLFGHMNFPVMILVGNLMPLFIFVLLWKHVVRDGKHRVLLLLPVSLLLFSLNYAETLDWAMIGLQHPAVILFALMSLYLLVKPQVKSFVAACLFGILASATSANGLLLWPVGLLYLLLHDRSVVKLIGWITAIAITAFAYFFRFQSGSLGAHGSLVGKLAFLTMFCGGALENMHHRPVPYISVLIGIFVLACFVHAVRTRYDRRDPFIFFSMIWLLFTAAVVANGRIAMGLQLSLSSRYKIFCDMLLICSYLYLLDRIRNRAVTSPSSQGASHFLKAATAAALVVCIGGDVAGGHLLEVRKSRAETAMRQYDAAPQSASPMFLVEDVLSPPEIEEENRARNELNEAIRLGIYTPPRP